MMTTKHSGGRWQPDWLGDGRTVLIDRGGMLACGSVCRCHQDGETGKADARLIAAAPDLLKACVEAVEWLEDGAPDDAVSTDELLIRRLIREAIAKAEGVEAGK